MKSSKKSDGRDLHAHDLLIGYSILAPSCYNTQPWIFALSYNEIKILADKDRWLEVADSDQREMYISVGCALENLLVAAEHFGYSHDVSYDEEEQAVVVHYRFGGKAIILPTPRNI